MALRKLRWLTSSNALSVAGRSGGTAPNTDDANDQNAISVNGIECAN
jgi:hypothetical protein